MSLLLALQGGSHLILAAGIASASAVGVPSIGASIAPVGVSSTTIVGAAAIRSSIAPIGVPTATAFGLPTVDTVLPPSIPAFGLGGGGGGRALKKLVHEAVEDILAERRAALEAGRAPSAVPATIQLPSGQQVALTAELVAAIEREADADWLEFMLLAIVLSEID